MDWSLGVESWSGFLEWNLGMQQICWHCVFYGVESWIAVLDLSHGVVYWSGFLEWNLGMNIESETMSAHYVNLFMSIFISIFIFPLPLVQDRWSNVHKVGNLLR